MSIVPDPATGFIDPFASVPTYCLFCDIVESDTREPIDADPRTIAKRTERFLKDTGVASDSVWGPEFEFHLFDRARFSDKPTFLLADLYSAEAHPFIQGEVVAGEGFQLRHQKGYHAVPPMDSLSDWRSELMELLLVAGVPVKYHHHEVGASGQCEIEIDLGSLTATADRSMIVKYFVRMLARRYGKVATFMPKPLFGEAGNGMHFHQFLIGESGPLFFDQKGYAGLSGVALSYIAGLLDHSRSLVAITNPSTNSYKRLVQGFEAPVKLFFSLANRSAAVRIPKYATSPEEKRMEFRPPDGTCNPYLAMPAMLLAGIDGIKRGLVPGEMNFGPFDEETLDRADEHFMGQLKSLPTSLDEALDAFCEDHAFLQQGDLFPAALIEAWIAIKRREARSVVTMPHPRELALYFNV
jgi:glutamine synthetase